MFTVENRIWNGVPANPGDFPFAALIIDHPNGICSGSFISQRHVITARHCFTSSRTGMTLKAGGICWGKSAGDCRKVDMIDIEVEFAIFQSMILKEIGPTKGFDRESAADLAIIQLKENVADKWFQSKRIDFTCLPPSKSTPIPDTYGVIGWGATELGRTGAAAADLCCPPYPAWGKWNLVVHLLLHVLRKASLAKGKCFDTRYNFCGSTPNNSKDKKSILGGDSGGPAVVPLKNSKKYLQYGLNHEGAMHEVLGRISISLSTAFYLNDFCFFLGLCPTDSVTGLKPYLRMEALFLPRERMGDGEHFYPFRRQSETQRQEILGKCNDLKSNAEQFSRDKICQQVDTPWAAVVVDDKSNALCGATYVTYKHLITLSECVRPAIKKAQRNSGGKATTFGVINVSGKLNQVEFISWARSHPVAIIQLKEDDTSITPICFKISLESRDLSTVFRSPDGIVERKINDTSSKLCNQWPHFCVTETYGCDERSRPFGLHGSAVVDAITNTIGGLRRTNPKIQAHGKALYIKMQQILNGLCVYLNRCDDEIYVFQSRLAYFSSFYYF
ncbi:trypsin domain-containing protein [Ditylenchus destructor]|nr:trypsin domain-containing protein [Ditylenchus destructor]